MVVLGLSDVESPNTTVESAHTPKEVPYAEAAYENDRQLGARVTPLRCNEDFVAAFPPSAKLAQFDNKFGYRNQDGGWAYAGQGLSMMIDKVKGLGGKVLGGKVFKNLITDDGKCKKVVCEDGSEIETDYVVVATGSWTASLFDDSYGFRDLFLATGYDSWLLCPLRA